MMNHFVTGYRHTGRSFERTLVVWEYDGGGRYYQRHIKIVGHQDS